MQESNASKEMEILKKGDKIGIKSLILAENSENKKLKQLLRVINLGGCKREERRSINKNVMNCLIEVKSGAPLALIWLKKHIDFEICKQIISDWKYTGDFFTTYLTSHLF